MREIKLVSSKHALSMLELCEQKYIVTILFAKNTLGDTKLACKIKYKCT